MSELTSTAVHQRFPKYFQTCAWAIPVMVIGQFSMIALAPVLVVLVAALADKRISPLRLWSLGLTIAYLVPLVVMKLRTDPAQSLSKDMHPALLVLIIVAAAALLVRMYVRRSGPSTHMS